MPRTDGHRGGFSSAVRVRRLGLGPKLVARLEARLGTRLAHRTTRRFQLTPEGQAFDERAVMIRADVGEAERLAGASARPAGRVRINSSASYVSHILAPILPTFLALYPEIELDIVQTDLVVDLVLDRTDIAIRAGPMPSSGLMARRLGSTRMRIVAAPAWITRHGLPRTIEELEAQDRLGFGYARAMKGWPMRTEAGEEIVLPAVGRVRMSDGEGIRRMALAGVAPARLAEFTIRGDLAGGRLVPLLERTNPGDEEAFHAVFIGQSASLPARARALLDFLAEYGQVA